MTALWVVCKAVNVSLCLNTSSAFWDTGLWCSGVKMCQKQLWWIFWVYHLTCGAFRNKNMRLTQPFHYSVQMFVLPNAFIYTRYSTISILGSDKLDLWCILKTLSLLLFYYFLFYCKKTVKTFVSETENCKVLFSKCSLSSAALSR